MKLSRKLYIIVDEKKEKLEDFIADKILEKFDKSQKVDAFEKIAIMTALNFANAYLVNRGINFISDDIKENIADAAIKGLSKANKAIQKQLKKKSKTYQENH